MRKRSRDRNKALRQTRRQQLAMLKSRLRARWLRWAYVPGVIVLGALLATLIDPWLTFVSPLPVQAVNAVLPVIVLLLVWGLTGRAWAGLLVEALLLGALRYADHLKFEYLNTDLVYADFTVLGGLLKDPHLVLGFVHTGPHLVFGIVAAVVAAVVLAWASRRFRGAGWPLRCACLIVAVAALAGLSFATAPAVIPSLGWEVYAQARGAPVVGVAGNILLGRLTTVDVERKADPAMMRAFWREPVVRKFQQQLASALPGPRPDIIVIQSESLFMPSQLGGFGDKPILPHILDKDAGVLDVPVFGGRTLQTEFEVQTGAPISFYPGSMFAYYELLHHRVDALPRVLDQDGYKTLVIHPNVRGFWNRNSAMPEMGFATFQSIGSFLPSDYSGRGHVSDLAVMQAVMSELDASDRPTYVTAITMDNHGPWGEFAPEDGQGSDIPERLTGEPRRQLADYLARAKDADTAFKFLTDALTRRKRPTIVVLYGDHLPALYEVYRELGFKDGQPAETHWPPYRIWANFPVAPPPHELPAYLLQGLLLRDAGAKLAGHTLANAIAGMVFADPAIPAAVRKRILDEYANIAAANLQRIPKAFHSETAFEGQQTALETLEALGHARVDHGDRDPETGDLVLKPGASGTAGMDLDIDHRIASISLRPYVPCAVPARTAAASFSVRADGRLVYEVPLDPYEVRLVTFDTRAVKHLQITVRAQGEAAVCGIHLRVAQLLTCETGCNVQPGDAISASRILHDDPTEGDLASLAALEPRSPPPGASRMANIRWLLSRELASQDGLVPIKLQSDAQLFMHPAEKHGAWAEFDIRGLESIQLTPHINPLDAHCKSLGPQAGIVELTVTVDGKPAIDRLRIDRDYHRPLTISLASASKLRMDVDEGNSGAMCDWFSVGVDRLTFTPAKGRAPALPRTNRCHSRTGLLSSHCAVTTILQP